MRPAPPPPLLLLLLLLLPPPSLSHDGTIIAATSPTSGQPSTELPGGKGLITTAKTIQNTDLAITGEKVMSATVSKGPLPGSSNSVSMTLAPTQKNTVIAPDQDEKVSTNPTIATSDSKGIPDLNKSILPSATNSMKPDTPVTQTAGPGAQGNPGTTVSHMTSENTEQTTSQPPPQVKPSSITPALTSIITPTSPRQPSANSTTLKPPESSSESPDKSHTASSSLGTKVVPSSSLYGTSPTRTSSVTFWGGPQSSSGTPPVPAPTPRPAATSSSTPGISSVPGTTSLPSETESLESPSSESPSQPPKLRPTGPPSSGSSGPAASLPDEGPRSSSTQRAATAPRAPSVPSPTSAQGDDRIKCESPGRLTDKMLLLNLTRSGLCAGNNSDDKLITLLCRAAKATFNPAQDQCHIRLVPIQDTQAVAIKEITVQTNLLPRDVYELLKDKWDELKEVGVSNMKLGDQGPPEETEDRFSMPLIITIVCMASFLLLVAALYGCCHQRLSQRKDQQRLTEELQTVENGYHDNPTLEVMETSSEMQEKKVVNLNGELGDSWIVPLDNLAKDDLDEEEDTHL
ncbi:podocalyxin [Canis lupus dingo]|uniref:Podocalyxin n=1 Tax=Canis lupus dingo TaxID=286419 RepID=A0A8C0LCP4_CANLU|nr:podocalyxin [Canis lupus dingo]